ncbi:CRM-domain containing factor CFM3, chloroplastic/mitochondrial isoform X2 [Macadamia integrifolia]|uniref:CRM-domain containing factor CFM3, chloroplastic/mitochondrial isoform X2 n=1 Tax=Macadamia integrifolia TaxID=60698 RepID=UPI001C4FD5F8|nr:CRM-domain containing factor CFM3, chloroplastic/mitochondrial isoform X2 [Macadamia integrifolia]
MAFSTAKLSELPFYSSVQLGSHSSLKLLFSSPKPLFRPFSSSYVSSSSSLRTSERRGHSDDGRNPKNRRYPWNDETRRRNTTISRKPRDPSSPWLKKWPSTGSTVEAEPKNDGERRIATSEKRPQEGGDGAENQYFDGDRGRNAIARIVHRLRNLGLGSDDDDDLEDFVEGDDAVMLTGDEKLGDLLKRTWSRPDSVVSDDKNNEGMVLPWERDDEESGDEEEMGLKKKRKVKAPTLAELTIEDAELRRLRTLGMTLRERINIPKAGVTQAILEKIHEKWGKSELVRLKFHETLAHDMKTAHELVEHRSGGLVIWRSGSVMVVHRGSNYEGPSSRPKSTDKEGDAPFVPDVSSTNNSILEIEDGAASTAEVSSPVVTSPVPVESITEEETEYNRLLNGLGPRFVDWWGTGVLPVDADLLPQSIPGYRTPFRLLPTGMRSRLTNAEMTNLRKLAKSLPCHFALGRNRSHQGLAAAIVKLWEKSLIVKIAVKRGIQNTNNKLMAEELKMLTGGVLLLRNKYYIVIYRGKDFLPTSVAAALSERQELAKEVQDVEEKSRSGPVGEVPVGEIEGPPLAGTLAEYHEAQARWGREISAEERERMREEASKVKSARVVKNIEHKLAVAQAKILRAEKLLAKIEASMVPVGPDDDKETVTDEERFMFRRVGLRMKSYLPLGIRGVFDGVIENMHLHWKHRELVKLISKQKNLTFVEDSAKLLEYESGGILVAIERVPKGHALIYYRGKNYKRPISLRPRNLLTKAKALKRSVAMQRHEALSQHISELERTIEQMKSEISEEEDSFEESDGDEDENEDEENLEEDNAEESDFLVNHDRLSKKS